MCVCAPPHAYAYGTNTRRREINKATRKLSADSRQGHRRRWWWSAHVDAPRHPRTQSRSRELSRKTNSCHRIADTWASVRFPGSLLRNRRRKFTNTTAAACFRWRVFAERLVKKGSVEKLLQVDFPFSADVLVSLWSLRLKVFYARFTGGIREQHL